MIKVLVFIKNKVGIKNEVYLNILYVITSKFNSIFKK